MTAAVLQSGSDGLWTFNSGAILTAGNGIAICNGRVDVTAAQASSATAASDRHLRDGWRAAAVTVFRHNSEPEQRRHPVRRRRRASGNLSIQANGRVAGNSVVIANTASASGSSVNVSGAGSSLILTGPLDVGAAGSGSFLISNAGTAVSASLDLAASAGGSGAITVSGTSSLFSDTGAAVIGDAGLGSLAIQAGGTSPPPPAPPSATPPRPPARPFNVTGAAPNLHVHGALVVDNAGLGQLSLSQGAIVTRPASTRRPGRRRRRHHGLRRHLRADRGRRPDRRRPNPSGSLNIVNGASVTVGSLKIGAGAGGSGNVVIGPGSHLTLPRTTINVGAWARACWTFRAAR